MLKDILTTSEIKELKSINQQEGAFGLQEKLYKDSHLMDKLNKYYQDEIPYEWQTGDMGSCEEWIGLQTLPRDLRFYE